jgi:hypothetical protein
MKIAVKNPAARSASVFGEQPVKKFLDLFHGHAAHFIELFQYARFAHSQISFSYRQRNFLQDQSFFAAALASCHP